MQPIEFSFAGLLPVLLGAVATVVLNRFGIKLPGQPTPGPSPAPAPVPPPPVPSPLPVNPADLLNVLINQAVARLRDFLDGLFKERMEKAVAELAGKPTETPA